MRGFRRRKPQPRYVGEYEAYVAHMLHEESFRYLRDARRALEPDVKEPLVRFIEQPMLEVWADRLGLAIEKVVTPDPAGQLFAILRPLPA